MSIFACDDVHATAPVAKNSKTVALRALQENLYTYVEKNTRGAFCFGVILVTIAAHTKPTTSADVSFDMVDALLYTGAGLAISPWVAALVYHMLDGVCNYLEGNA